MAGVKGRSGRKKAPFQEQRQRVIDKAWAVIERLLDDPNTPPTTLADIAKSIVTKNIPQETEYSGNISLNFSANGTLMSAAERGYAKNN